MKEKSDNRVTKKEFLYTLAGVVVGIVIAWSVSVYAVNGNNQTMMRTLNMHNPMIEAMNQHPGTCSATQCTQGE